MRTVGILMSEISINGEWVWLDTCSSCGSNFSCFGTNFFGLECCDCGKIVLGPSLKEVVRRWNERDENSLNDTKLSI